MRSADPSPAPRADQRSITARHIGAIAVALAALAAVTSPLLWSEERDSYPLSTYPMFARDRGRIANFTTAVGIDEDGGQRFLSPEAIAQTNEPVQAAATAAREVARGRAGELCRAVADAADPTLQRIEVLSATYDVVAWFDGDRTPLDRTVHATCEIPG